MSSYYCHKCSKERGFLYSGATEINFSGTPYQFGKFLKHTVAPELDGLNSVFAAPGFEKYKEFAVNTLLSGGTEFDDQGRKNIFWYAGEEIGLTLSGSAVVGPTNAVKVVLPDDPLKAHAFPIITSTIITKSCEGCSTNVLTGGTVSISSGATNTEA